MSAEISLAARLNTMRQGLTPKFNKKINCIKEAAERGSSFCSTLKTEKYGFKLLYGSNKIEWQNN